MATTKKVRKKIKRPENPPKKARKLMKLTWRPPDDVNAPPDKQGAREIENEVYDGMPAGMADLMNKPVVITDVMPVDMVEAINRIDGISSADWYFIGAMAAKVVNVLKPVEKEHLNNLLKPLIDTLNKSHP